MSPSSIGPIGRGILIAVLAGFLAGSLAGGLGSRAAMRVSAVLAGPAKQGTKTEAGATVGRITLRGSLFLVVLGSVVGALGGLAYCAVRPWVAGAGRWRGLTFGAILLATFGSMIIEGDNLDFHELGPPLLNIATFGGLFLWFGWMLPPLVDWLERALPRPSWRPSGVLAAAAYIGALFLLLPVTMLMLEPKRLPIHRALVAYTLAVLPLSAALLRRHAGQFQRLSDLRGRPGVIARGVLALPLGIGLGLTLRAVLMILTARP